MTDRSPFGIHLRRLLAYRHAEAHFASAEIAAPVWNARQLTSDQIRHVVEAAKDVQ